jgi:hypothetical protein
VCAAPAAAEAEAEAAEAPVEVAEPEPVDPVPEPADPEPAEPAPEGEAASSSDGRNGHCMKALGACAGAPTDASGGTIASA